MTTDNKPKLIIEEMEMLCEAKSSDDGKLYIEGIVAQADIINRNGRRYSRSVMEEAVREYNENYVLKNKAIGELNHPPRPYADPQFATHRIVEMKMKGNDVWAKAIVLEDATKLRALINSGWLVQASTRGLGNVKKINNLNESYNDVTKYKLTVGFDIVQDQSAPGALMDSVYESGIYECVGEDTYAPYKELSVEESNGSTDKPNWEKFFNLLKEKLEQ